MNFINYSAFFDANFFILEKIDVVFLPILLFLFFGADSFSTFAFDLDIASEDPTTIFFLSFFDTKLPSEFFSTSSGYSHLLL